MEQVTMDIEKFENYIRLAHMCGCNAGALILLTKMSHTEGMEFVDESENTLVEQIIEEIKSPKHEDKL